MLSKLYPILLSFLLVPCTHTNHSNTWEARGKAAGEFAVDCVLWEVGSQLMSSALRAHRATQFAEALRGGKFTEEAIFDLTNAIKTGNATKSLQQLKQTLFKYPELKKAVAFTEGGGKLKKVSMLTEAMEGGVGMEKAVKGVGMVEKGVNDFEAVLKKTPQTLNEAAQAAKTLQESEAAKHAIAAEEKARKGMQGAQDIEKIGGKWIQTNEHMKLRSANYQTKVTGKPANLSYKLNGVKFDGMKNGVLIDAKAGYKQFIDIEKNVFKKWFVKSGGERKLIDQAKRQVAAAQGKPIQWFFEEKETLEVMKKILPKEYLIKLTYLP